MEEKLKHIKALDGFRTEEVQRFLEKIRISKEIQPLVSTPCWDWVYYRDPRGYGKFTRSVVYDAAGDRSGGVSAAAHRVSHEFFIGPIPFEYQVHHKCDNRSCVNPDHLEALDIPSHVKKTTGHVGNQTHCHRGHEFTPENTRVYNGFRSCRACANFRARLLYDPDGAMRGSFSSLYCVNDHPLFGDNMHLVSLAYGRYRRYCKTCRREAVERHAAHNQDAILVAKTIRRADIVAGRKLKNLQTLVSLKQTIHLQSPHSGISLLRRLLNDCD